MYVICVFVYLYVSIDFFACHCVCLYVNCILYTLIYVHIFSYLVNKLEIRWIYLSPIGKDCSLCCTLLIIHFILQSYYTQHVLVCCFFYLSTISIAYPSTMYYFSYKYKSLYYLCYPIFQRSLLPSSCYLFLLIADNYYVLIKHTALHNVTVDPTFVFQIVH